jgi:6-phosphogluconate dehydrogenase
MEQKGDFGLVGLAVMGENLVLNIESRGFTVAVFNRTIGKSGQIHSKPRCRERNSLARIQFRNWLLH